MNERFSLHVNVISHLNNKEFTRDFTQQETAECYIRAIGNQLNYSVTEFNFAQKFTNEELDAWEAKAALLNKEATRLQKQAMDRTHRNFENPEYDPCEVCGKKHRNYECCDQCNYNTHRCHFCGDYLGHSEVSVCYILEGWDE